MKKTFNQFINEVMTSTSGGIAGMHQSIEPLDDLPQIAGREADRLAIKPRKKKKNESFAGCPVFTVSNDDYAKCMHGRMRYERWNKKLNMEDIDNQEIRTYAHRNPGKPIIVQDDRYGTMSYFIPPKQEVSESVEVDESNILRRLKMDKFSRSERKREKKRKKSVRKYNKMVGIPLAASYDAELDEGIRDFKVGDKVKWVGEDEHEGDIESKNLIGQIGIIKTIKKFGRFHKGDIKFRKKLVKGAVLELDVIKESYLYDAELDEAKDYRRELKQRHTKALNIISTIDSIFGKSKWTDSFGNYVTKKIPDEVDTSIDAGWEYHQNRGRGDWHFIIDPNEMVKYSYKGKTKKEPYTRFLPDLMAMGNKNESVVKKGKPIPMDLLYPKGHPRVGEIVGGKKKDNTAAVAKQVKQVAKKYTKGKVTVRSKGGKTRFIMLSADNIDNKLRKMMLDVAYPKANIRDKSNISYGNISDRIISATVEHWTKALGLKESVEMDEGGFTVPGYDQDIALKANMPKWKKDADARTRQQHKKNKKKKKTK